MSDRVPTIIRTGFRGLSFCSPKLAGALAFRLFCRPPDARKIKPVQSALKDIAPALLNHAQHDSTARVEGPAGVFNISRYTFEPDPARYPKPLQTTLLLHGWSSRATHMLAFVQPLLDQGHRVLAVDLPAHGDSSGRQFHLPLGTQALHAVHTQTQPWDNVIAHSLGGAVATALLSGSVKSVNRVSVNRLVLISTPNSIPDIFADFADMIGLSAKAHAELRKIAERLTGNPLSTFVGQSQLLDAAIPTLVIHDTQDQELPLSNATEMVAGNTQAQLHEVSGHGHRRILYAQEVVERATDFCSTDLASQASLESTSP